MKGFIFALIVGLVNGVSHHQNQHQHQHNQHNQHHDILGTNTSVPSPPTPTQPLSDYLWEQTSGLRNQALNTYFVQGIGHGTLDPTAFGAYMVQDAVYCYLAQRSIDVAASRAVQPDVKQFLQHKSQSYLSYYQALYAQWHVNNANGIQLGQACQSYADYENTVARTMDGIYMVVAMTPCLKLWPWLGQQLNGRNHGVYTKWYNDNFDPTYNGFKALDDLIDAAESKGTINRTLALQVYTRCMQGEFEFFNSTQVA